MRRGCVEIYIWSISWDSLTVEDIGMNYTFFYKHSVFSVEPQYG